MMEALTLERAHRLIAGATSQASAEFHRPICVPICDEYGLLVAFARMEGTPIGSIEKGDMDQGAIVLFYEKLAQVEISRRETTAMSAVG